MRGHEEALDLAGGRRLAELEKVINRGKKSFIEVGLALAEIRDLRLYRLTFKTFEGYCREKWGWGRQRAYQLIAASEAARILPDAVNQNVNHGLQNERQARVIASVPEADRAEVLEAVVEAGPVTARAIHEAAGKAGRAEVVDAAGPLAARAAASSEISPSPYRIVTGRCVVLQAGWTFGRRVLRKLLKEVTAD